MIFSIFKFIKKVLSFFGYVILAFIIVFILSLIFIPFMNDNIASKVAGKLVEIPLPDDTEFIEKQSIAGKLTGNGNGMQYLGIILIKSELSIKELKKYYSDYYKENKSDFIEFGVKQQRNKKIKIVEHGDYSFDSEVEENNYYIVYAWGKEVEDFRSILYDFDLRGH